MAATLPAEVAGLLRDVHDWNTYAATMNARAVAAGLVTVAELEADRRRIEAARRELLARWSA